MGRKMEWNGQVVTVDEHIITRNFWEFYLIDDKREQDIRLAIVMGHDTELGDVSMSEIRPHVVSRKVVTSRTELMPAAGGEWVE